MGTLRSGSPKLRPGAHGGRPGGARVILKNNGQRILTLHLKRTWWEMIRAGVKRTELRQNSPHNRRLLAGRRYDEIHLWAGYPPRSHRSKLLRFAHRRTQQRFIGYHPEFGLGPRCVWEIQLGDRLA